MMNETVFFFRISIHIDIKRNLQITAGHHFKIRINIVNMLNKGILYG
jgi:hypothetical protein